MRRTTRLALAITASASTPTSFSPFLENASIHKDSLDVARLGVEDHLAHVVKAWRKVEGMRIEYNDVGLLDYSRKAGITYLAKSSWVLMAFQCSMPPKLLIMTISLSPPIC